MAPDAPVSTTPPGNLNLCSAGSTTLSATGTNISWFDQPVGGTALGGGGAFATGTLTNSATFYAQDSTCAASPRTAITVNVTVIDAGVTEEAGALVANATGVAYQWLNCGADFAPVIGANEQNYEAPTGLWAVQLTDGACTDTSACVQVIITNITAPTEVGLTIHPNPTEGPLNLVLPSSWQSSDHLMLCDAAGRNAMNVAVNGSRSIQIDVSVLAPGIYLLRSSTGHTTRVVVQ